LEFWNLILKIEKDKQNDDHNEGSEMEVEWTKILEKPDGKYKVDGSTLLKFKITTEKLNEELDSLRKKYADLEKQSNEQKDKIKNLEAEAGQLKSKVKKLEKEIEDKTTSLEGQMKEIVGEREVEFKTQIEEAEEKLNQKQAEVEKLERDLSSMKDQLSQTKQKLTQVDAQAREKAAKVTELENLKIDLNTKIQTLSDRVNEVEPALKESGDLKAENGNLKTSLEEKVSEISQLNEKVKKLESDLEAQGANREDARKQEIEAIAKKHSEEIATIKADYEKQIQALKEVYGKTSKEATLKGDEQVIILRYNGEEFLLVKQKPEEGIGLIMDGQERKWLLVWDANASFIDRRTAERRARSIAKSGWPLPNGARLGMAFDLEIQGEKKVPERLLRDQHQYMD
jgi:chromosome segregation ATPase